MVENPLGSIPRPKLPSSFAAKDFDSGIYSARSNKKMERDYASGYWIWEYAVY